MFAWNIARRFVVLSLAGSLAVSCSFVKEHTSPETYNTLTFSDGGSEEAGKATVAYSQGDFAKTEEHVLKALEENPKQQQALLVGALMSEKTGRLNRARQYYEELIIINGNETTILGNEQMLPEKISDVAKKRLRLLEVKQSNLVIEDANGAKVFNISQPAGQVQSRSAIEEALFKREQQKIAEQQPSSEAEIRAVQILFTDQEQNIISRFLILKELAEKDLITKQEFLRARMANVGGLLPLTHKPGAFGIDRSVPAPDVILERIKVLKDAVESRAITPQEFSAERDLIIEALLPPNPRQRMQNKIPSRDVMGAAKDLRKLEILYDLNLITAKEKAAEKAAIEKYLGINRAPAKKAAAKKVVKPAAQPCTIDNKSAPCILTDKKTEVKETPEKELVKTEIKVIEEVKNTPVPAPTTPQKQSGTAAPQPLIPAVSSPFDN